MIDLVEVGLQIPIRFFSNDIPADVAWPYILVHTNDYEQNLRKWGKFAQLIMFDVHVHRFQHIGDYPKGYIFEYMKLCENLARKWREKFTFVLLDLPYDPKYFHAVTTGAQYPANVWKTYMYHLQTLKWGELICRKYGSKMVIVLQHRAGYFLQPYIEAKEKNREAKKRGQKTPYSESYIKKLREEGLKKSKIDIKRSAQIVDDLLTFLKDETVLYGVGLGSLCVFKEPTIIVELIKEMAGHLPRHLTLHGFGLHFRVVKMLPEDIKKRYSFDSTGWTRTPDNIAMKLVGATKRYSCKKDWERTLYFLRYVAKLASATGRRDLCREVMEIAIEYARKLGIEPDIDTEASCRE